MTAVDAARAAGYSPNSVAQTAARVAETMSVEIEAGRKDLRDSTLVDASKIMARLDLVARAELRQVMQWTAEGDVTLTPSGELTPEASKAVESISVADTQHGRTIRVKMKSSTEADSLLCKILGLLRDKLEISGVDGDPVTIYIPDNNRDQPVKGGSDGGQEVEGKVGGQEAGASEGSPEAGDPAGQAEDGDAREAQGA